MEVMLNLTDTRLHDESRQGEAFACQGPGAAGLRKKFYIESYGCAMNFADSEVVASILTGEGFSATSDFADADLILLNTCSIREKAEQTVRKRLLDFRNVKKNNPSALVGILGCMAERLKAKLLEEEQLVDLVVGPDAYRSLPALIADAAGGEKSVNVLLSREETYADISPIKLDSNGVTSFVSIMRGCDNMCSFCVVPFTRGRERSRDAASVLRECRQLFDMGYREITLLGQNVDSYSWTPDAGSTDTEPVSFARLLETVAMIDPALRVRFSTSHPKDITDEVLHVIARHDNICKYVHLPVQSGSDRVLQLMNRGYSSEWYKAKIDRIRELIPECGVSSDIIAGFCSETEEEHKQTLALMEYCRYDFSYMYFYSERPGTLAARRYADDVPEPVKKRRLAEIVDLQRKLSEQSHAADVGKIVEILIEGNSKKSESDWMGRSSENKVVVFPKNGAIKKGEYVRVRIERSTGGTLLGVII